MLSSIALLAGGSAVLASKEHFWRDWTPDEIEEEDEEEFPPVDIQLDLTWIDQINSGILTEEMETV